jgi:hypothetical protein
MNGLPPVLPDYRGEDRNLRDVRIGSVLPARGYPESPDR